MEVTFGAVQCANQVVINVHLFLVLTVISSDLQLHPPTAINQRMIQNIQLNLLN